MRRLIPLRRLISLMLLLAIAFASAAALAQDVPGVEIIDVARAKITGEGTFYIYADESVYEKLKGLADPDAEGASGADEGEAPEDDPAPTTADAASPYVQAALAVLGGLEGGLPAEEAEASARYVLTEHMGGSADASILAFAAYAAAYIDEAVSAMAALEGGFPSVEAYAEEALRSADVPSVALQRAHDAVYGELYESYLGSSVSAESAAEMAITVAEPTAVAAAAVFVEHVCADETFTDRLNAYVAGKTDRKFVLFVDDAGNLGGVVVGNITRVFTRDSVNVVLIDLSLESAEAYDGSSILMIGGDVQKVTTGHAASFFADGAQIGRGFALNASTHAYSDCEVGTAFADPDASVDGADRVQNDFFLHNPLLFLR